MKEGEPKFMIKNKTESSDSQGGKTPEGKNASVKELNAIDGIPPGQVISKQKEETVEEKKKSLWGGIKAVFEKRDATEADKEKYLKGPRYARYLKEEAISHDRGEALIQFYKEHSVNAIPGEYDDGKKKFENLAKVGDHNSI